MAIFCRVCVPSYTYGLASCTYHIRNQLIYGSILGKTGLAYESIPCHFPQCYKPSCNLLETSLFKM